MAETKQRRKSRAPGTGFAKGLLLAGVGLALLLVPLLTGSASMGRSMMTGLRLSALVLGLGLLLLGLYMAATATRGRASAATARVKRSRYRRRRSAEADPARRTAVKTEADLASFPASTAFVPFPPRDMWCPEVFDDIEWRRFEAVCEALFAQAGFETRPQSHGADGGVDLWLHSRNAQGPAAVVRCKHWHGRPVGEKELREFHAEMVAHQLQRGTYASTSTFTPQAEQFAAANGINAMDGAALLALIARRMPAQQRALLAVAYEGDYWRPTCASCGIQMVERTPSRGGADFWGCANYPRCLARLPMGEAK